MKKRLISSLLVGVLVLSGCVRAASGQKPSPAELSDALLTITDMKGNWSETQRQAFTQRGAENPSIDPSVWCTAASEVTKNLIAFAGESGADVEMQFNNSSEIRRIMRLQAWANDEVKSYFRDAKEAVRICAGKSSTDESGVKTTNTLIANRKIGDESISWSEKVTPPVSTQKDKMETIGRTTIARFGDIIMVMQGGDAAPAGPSDLMNEDEWW